MYIKSKCCSTITNKAIRDNLGELGHISCCVNILMLKGLGVCFPENRCSEIESGGIF